MLEDGKLTYTQIILLIVISRIIVPITYLPALASPPGNQDIWISSLLGFPIMLLVAGPIYMLLKRFPNQTIIQYSQVIMGKAGKFIGLLYIWIFIQSTAITLMQLSMFLTTAVMAETPLLFFQISMMLMCAYAVRSGLEVLGRLSEIITPISIVAVIMLCLLLTKDMDFKALTPVMEKGFYPVLHGGFTITVRTLEIIELAMLAPYLQERHKVNTILVVSCLVITIIFLILPISLVCVFGVEEAKNRSFPFYSMVSLIDIGNFWENIQAVHMAVWVLGVFIKISLDYYLAALAIGQLFNLQDYRPVVLPVGAIIVAIGTIIAPSLSQLQEFLSYKIFTWYSLLFITLIPCFLLLIAIIRKKGEGQQC